MLEKEQMLFYLKTALLGMEPRLKEITLVVRISLLSHLKEQ